MSEEVVCERTVCGATVNEPARSAPSGGDAGTPARYSDTDSGTREESAGDGSLDDMAAGAGKPEARDERQQPARHHDEGRRGQDTLPEYPS